MTRNLTKLWMSGLQRLLAAQSRTVRRTARQAGMRSSHAAAAWRAAESVAEAVDAASREQAAPQPPRESRVRPRAAAWAAGGWHRAVHVAPAMPLRTARELPYGLYLPPDRKTAGMPLVVMLHGCKQTIDEFAEGTRMNLLADRHHFAVLYPEQPENAHAHGCWHWYDAREQAGGGEAAAVVSLVDSLVAEYGFDDTRVYIAGLSAGAGLATLLATCAPQRFAAVALHSGPAFGEAHSGITALDVMRRGTRHDPASLVEEHVDLDAYPGMPAIILHGDDDRVVAPVNGEQLTEQFLRLNGLAGPATNVREEQQEGCVIREYRRARGSVVRRCRIKDIGHAWSGGDDTVPFHSAAGPDASAMIWRFFEQQRRTLPKAKINTNRDELVERA